MGDSCLHIELFAKHGGDFAPVSCPYCARDVAIANMRAALREALAGWEHGVLYAYHDSTDRMPFSDDPAAKRIAELRAKFGV